MERCWFAVESKSFDISIEELELQCARILVRLNGRSLPASLQLVVGSSSYSIQLWWEVPLKFSMVVPRSCSNEPLELEVKGDKGGGSHTGIGVEKDLFLLQTGREGVSNSGGKSGHFGESSNCCVQKVVVDGEDFGGGGRGNSVGRRDCLEEIVGLERENGPMWEGPSLLQKAQRVSGFAVGEDGELGWAQGCGPSFIREKVSGRVVNPLGLLVWGDRATETVPTELIESPSTWILGTDEALQAEATRYSSHSFPLVLRGGTGFLFFFSFLSEKGCERGLQSCLWLGGRGG